MTTMSSSVHRPVAGDTSLPRRLKSWWKRHRLLHELTDCDTQERQRLQRDLGLSELDLAAALKAVPHAQRLLADMLRQLGLEHDGLEALYPRVAWDLNRVCAACPNKRRCRRELASSTARTNFREFCLNAMTLNALAADPVWKGKRA
jgi:hypothetical protein